MFEDARVFVRVPGKMLEFHWDLVMHTGHAQYLWADSRETTYISLN